VPTYQYACTTCDHRLEAVQSFTDAPLTQCPECEGRLRKLFSAVGIVFKGSGFYRTDSRAAATGANGKGSGSGSGDGDRDRDRDRRNGAAERGESGSGGASGTPDGAASKSGGKDSKGAPGGKEKAPVAAAASSPPGIA
jgi:putative FmdB family regulatory protein